MDGEAREYRRYRITGRVQGVGFRWWTRKTARALGLVGRVRNVPDGSVEVRVGGVRAALDELETMLGQGPAMSRVRAVEERPDLEGREGATWTDFDIERD